jgi:hypothetical protein
MDEDSKFLKRNITQKTLISGISALSAHMITGVLYPLELVKIRLQGLYILIEN